VDWIRLAQIRDRGLFKHDNEHSGSIKARNL